jgi:hypothetical protein
MVEAINDKDIDKIIELLLKSFGTKNYKNIQIPEQQVKQLVAKSRSIFLK